MSDFWKSLRLCCLWYYRKHDSFSFSIWMNSSEKERRAKCTYSCNFNTWRCATNIFLLFFSLSLFYVILILIYILWNSLELLGCLKQQCKDRRFFFTVCWDSNDEKWMSDRNNNITIREGEEKEFSDCKASRFYSTSIVNQHLHLSGFVFQITIIFTKQSIRSSEIVQ